jgi:3-deoxy-D-manno-octulosonic-acid transferase
MLFYNLGIYLYTFVIFLASVFKSKAKLWVNGRKNWKQNYSAQLKKLSGQKKIWVHCASLGEFEQGRPLMESIKKQHPDYKIILTFFSPSGFEVSKNYESADCVFYLPYDSGSNARTFLDLVAPDKIIFIKYEFWVNYLNEIKKRNIECYLVSAVFKDHHPFFKWYGKVFINSLGAFKTLFVQDKNSLQLLKSININNAEISGDTRFDRVLEIKNKFSAIPEIEKFKSNNKLIIAGSTWPKDEDLVLETFKELNFPNTKLIIVPHDIEEDLLKETISKLDKHRLTYSLFSETINNDSQVLVLNTMGLLSKSYHYANQAYIGGGFDGGIHNCLEPAVYGIPVTFYGNDFQKYNEAVDLVNLKVAVNVNSIIELKKAWAGFIETQASSNEISEKLHAYFEANSKSTEKILVKIRF